MPKILRDLPLISAAAIALAGGWLVPGTTLCAVLGWATAILIILLFRRSKTPYRSFYLFGLIYHPIAFSWLVATIDRFGGFGILPALAIFALFVAGSSLQLLLFVFIARSLPRFCDRFELRIALAWVATEMLFTRIFPWYLGHMQLGFLPFAQLAEFGGAPLVSFLVVWIASLALSSSSRAKIAAAALFAAFSLLGWQRLSSIESEHGRPVPVAIVQANITIEEKLNISLLVINRARYEQLTAEAIKPGDDTLIIWPETVSQDFIPDTVGRTINSSKIPTFPAGNTLLLGALTYDTAHKLYNSAMLIQPNGTIPPPYHKLILMPFGEYTPFGDTIPFLRQLNGLPQEFGAGLEPIIFPVHVGDDTVKVAPLICYEDVVPDLSRKVVNDGAELLVNITNDGWFGNSAALAQHHLIASFRAIETRRFLIRSTNTGLTGIVDPVGRTIASIPPYSEGVLNAVVEARTALSPYVILHTELLWQILSVLLLLSCILSLFRKKSLR